MNCSSTPPLPSVEPVFSRASRGLGFPWVVGSPGSDRILRELALAQFEIVVPFTQSTHRMEVRLDVYAISLNPAMTDPTPASNASTKAVQADESGYVPPTPLRCLTGAFISAALGVAMYFLTRSIASTFADAPLPAANTLALRISIAVRTLILGMSSLGTSIFGIATFGLIGLAIQLIIQNSRKSAT